jgi:hypothetical protein
MNQSVLRFILYLSILIITGVMIPYGYSNLLGDVYHKLQPSALPEPLALTLEADELYLDALMEKHDIQRDAITYELYKDIKPGWYIPQDREQVSNRIAQNEVLDSDQFIRIPDTLPIILRESDFHRGQAYIDNYMVFKVMERTGDRFFVYPVAYYRLCPTTGSRQFIYDGRYLTELHGHHRYDVFTGQGITTDKALIRVNVEMKIRKRLDNSEQEGSF